MGTPRTDDWLLVVAGEALTGDAFGETSESELSGLATNSPAPPRRLLRAPCGLRTGLGVEGPAEPPVERDRRGGPDIARDVGAMYGSRSWVEKMENIGNESGYERGAELLERIRVARDRLGVAPIKM